MWICDNELEQVVEHLTTNQLRNFFCVLGVTYDSTGDRHIKELLQEWRDQEHGTSSGEKRKLLIKALKSVNYCRKKYWYQF